MITTTHQYLEKYPITKNSKKLIVGTIHPHNHEDFRIPFFYGNVTSIWSILSEAFPNDLKKPLSLNNILNFLVIKKISVSDTIKKCNRTKLTALDKDLTPIELNYQIIDDIRNSNICEIFFTSGFGKNNAFKLFYVDILKQKITDEIKEKRGIILDEKYFGRPMKLNVLYSPSGAANIGLSKSKIYLASKHEFEFSNRPVYDFKVKYYRNNFERK